MNSHGCSCGTLICTPMLRPSLLNSPCTAVYPPSPLGALKTQMWCTRCTSFYLPTHTLNYTHTVANTHIVTCRRDFAVSQLLVMALLNQLTHRQPVYRRTKTLTNEQSLFKLATRFRFWRIIQPIKEWRILWVELCEVGLYQSSRNYIKLKYTV